MIPEISRWRNDSKPKRIGKDPRAIKTDLQDSWAISDTQSAFRQALKERGFTLARGDRRGFVVLDLRCEVFSISKWLGLSTKDVRVRLTDHGALPPVDMAREQIAKDMAARLCQLQKQHRQAVETRLSQIELKRTAFDFKQRMEDPRRNRGPDRER